MQKNRVISLFIAFSILLSLFSVSALRSSNVADINDILKAAGIIKENRQKQDDKIEVATANGISLYKREIELKKDLSMIVFKLDEKDAYKDVIKGLAKNKVLYKMAEEEGLALTMEEALEASLLQKDMVQQDEKALENMNSYIKALGLTEDQYWTEYHVIETQQYLSIEKLKESIANEGIEQGILPKVKIHTKETSKLYKDYIDKEINEIEDNIVIEFIDEQYEEKFNN
ncbi:MAG TPA: hypothetical protein PLL98_03815 [Bacillota bacterium]|nr:hypothetical protein [Bacillota bacterium]HPL54224.1 hypothetical protein [Bacillota bacterium]